jgi:hypothetical protein
MAEQSISGFVTSTLYDLKRKVAATHNEGGYYSVYAETARLLIAAFPNITAPEKAQVFANFNADVEQIRQTTGKNYHDGLGSAARVLGIKATSTQKVRV